MNESKIEVLEKEENQELLAIEEMSITELEQRYEYADVTICSYSFYF